MKNTSKKLFLQMLTNDYKYKLCVISCVLIHTLIAIYSLFCNITPLMIFNIGSIITYFLCLFLFKRQKALVLYIGILEIIIHSFVAVILVGNDFGFSMYFILLVPMTYHLLHSINEKHYFIKATLLSCISIILFATCYIISIYNVPVFTSQLLEDTKSYVYLFNMLVTFCILIFFSIFFIAETEFAYRKLYNKNLELDTLANTDPLTGLFNRRTMSDKVMDMYEEYSRTGTNFSIVLADIDDFKHINDTYGHDYGDVVLETIAKLFLNFTRGDDIVCRWGGEEFLILLNGTDVTSARTISERIRKSISNTSLCHNDETLHITMTFGVASAYEASNYDELFTIADKRMYEGKKTGKNKVV